MKRISAGKKLPFVTVCWGVLALALRRQLYLTGVDAKNLLVQNHPLSIALMVLTIGVLVRSALFAWKLEVSETHAASDLFGALGNVAAGAGVLVTVLTGTAEMGELLGSAWQILGLTAPVCLGVAGAFRILGKRPFFLLHVVACLFFLVHIVTRYQLWSSNPQMQDYVFALLGAMALTLFGFYTAAMEADCGSPRIRYGMGLAAIYLCLGELARSSCPALYLGGILWVLTELVSVRKEKK